MELVWHTVLVVTQYTILEAWIVEFRRLFFRISLTVLAAHSKLCGAAFHLEELARDHCIKDSKLVALINAINCHVHPIHELTTVS